MKTKGKYILDGHKVVPCYDLIQWATWFETANRHVSYHTQKGIVVSTIFLGLDFNLSGGDYPLDGDHEPMVFETLVKGGPYDGYTDKYCTWEQAEAGHQAACKLVGVSLDSLPFEYEN